MITAILIALAPHASSPNHPPSTQVEPLEVALTRTLAQEAGRALGGGSALRVSIGEFGYGAERKASPFAALVRAQLSTAVQACNQLEEYSRTELDQVSDELARSVSDSYLAIEGDPVAGNLSLVQGIFTGHYLLKGDSVALHVQLVEVQSGRVLLGFQLQLSLPAEQLAMAPPPVLAVIGDVLGDLAPGAETIDGLLGEMRDIDSAVRDLAPAIGETVANGAGAVREGLQALAKGMAAAAGLALLSLIWLVGSGRVSRFLDRVNQ